MALLKRSPPWLAQPTRLSSESNNATEDSFIVLPFGPVSPHRISPAKGQNKVNEARGHVEISIDRTCGRHPRSAITTSIVVRTANPLKGPGRSAMGDRRDGDRGASGICARHP